jgi:hypothetical protein
MMDVRSATLALGTPLHFSFDVGGFITYSNGISSGGRVVKNRYYDIYSGDSSTPAYPCVCVLEISHENNRTKFRVKDLDNKEKLIFDNRGSELRFKEIDAPTLHLFRAGEEIRFDQNLTDSDVISQSLHKLVPNKLYQVKQSRRGIDGSFIFLSGKIDGNHVVLIFTGMKVDTVNGDIGLIAQEG